jgi:hypothetical protein
MDQTDQQTRLRERYLLALIEATLPLQQASQDPEITLELLIQASDLLKEHLQKELEERRGEQD